MADSDKKKQSEQPTEKELTDAEADAVSGGTGASVDDKLQRRKPKYSGTPPVLVPIVVE